MAIELVIYGARQFGIKSTHLGLHGDLCYWRSRRGVEDNLGVYGSSGISYGGLSRGGCEAYLVTLTDKKCSFLCFSGQRGTIALYLSLCMRSISVS